MTTACGIRRLTQFVLAVSGLLFAQGLRADTIIFTLDGNFAPPDYLFYSYTDTSGQAQNDIPVSPYITTVNGGIYQNTIAYTFCFDFNSPTNIATPYSGSFQRPTDTATLEATFLMDLLN